MTKLMKLAKLLNWDMHLQMPQLWIEHLIAKNGGKAYLPVDFVMQNESFSALHH